MEKVVKNYIKYMAYGREWAEKEIEHNDPELVDTSNMTKFMFIERSYVMDGEDVYVGKMKVTSPVYHVGRRISLDEIMEIASEQTKEYCANLAKRKNYISFCSTDMGYLEEMYEGEITLEEYKASKKGISK